jgi:hypothetical protein
LNGYFINVSGKGTLPSVLQVWSLEYMLSAMVMGTRQGATVIQQQQIVISKFQGI